MQFDFKINNLLVLCILILNVSCGISGGNAPNLFGNMKIFVTSSTYTGALGGISGADEKCMSDANYPGEGTYRALLSDGSSRTTDKDWVIIAGVKYIQAEDETVIATANDSSIFKFPLSGAFKTSGSTLPYWSGLNASWVGESGVVNNCQNWTSANSIYSGPIGRAEDKASTAIYDSSVLTGCNTSLRLLCVEQ